MSEQLSPYEFAQLLVDVVEASYNKNSVGRKDGKFKAIPVTERFDNQKEIRTYDISTKDTILFNEEADSDTLEINFTAMGEPVSYMLKDSPWPFVEENE